MKSTKRSPALLLMSVWLLSVSAEARLSRVVVDSVEPAHTVAGAAPYEILRGVFYGELDLRAPGNAIITDLAAAPRNKRGQVEYSATFALARPIDLQRASGVLHYEVPNRGFAAPPSANVEGEIGVVSGWQGDIAPGSGLQTATVPVAHARGGRSIAGPVYTRFYDISAGAKSIPIGAGLVRLTARPSPVSLDTHKARLTVELRAGATPEMIAPDAWAFADCSVMPFPGKPDPALLCLRDGFVPNAAYSLLYQGKDPKVLGIGFAATRDLVSFLRSGRPDNDGNANPAGGAVRWTVASGTSQSGNFLRSFVHLGFNADETGKRVFDGVNPNIAARQVPLNLRFGVPGGAASPYEPGSEGTLWWAAYRDRARGLGTSSLLSRCQRSNTCPKIVETFGSAEFWGLRASPGLVGTDARADLPLPDNVRRYYFPGVTHGGARGGNGFRSAGDSVPPGCILRGNANSSMESLGVAQRALVAWVRDGTEPPPSRYPTLANGDLVAPTAAAMGWQVIPDLPTPEGKLNAFNDYRFGSGFRAADVSGVMSWLPPREPGMLPSRVPRVDADGNETAGIASVQLQVPLGSYLGWNVQAKGFLAGGGCGFAGGFIPFARTQAARVAHGDPRLSLEERYRDHAGFVARVRAAVERQQAAGWLLPDDAARLLADAEASDVLREAEAH